MTAEGRPSKPQIFEAQPLGLCAGVVRAIDAYDNFITTVREKNPNEIVYSVGEPAHNTHINERFKKMGVQFVGHVSEVPDGGHALFGPHGSTPDDIEEAKRRGMTFVDTECPLVTKVKKEVARNAQEGRTTIYFGQKGHAEARAVMGVAPESVILVEGVEQALSAEVLDPSKVAFNTQTTHNYDEAMEMAGRLVEKYPDLVLPPKEDACFATRNRQTAVKVIAEEAEAIVVLGSSHSSNSRRLAEVAEQSGANNVFFIDSAEDLREEQLDGLAGIGFSAGASVEDAQVEKLRQVLRSKFGSEIITASVADESKISFAPPTIQGPQKNK